MHHLRLPALVLTLATAACVQEEHSVGVAALDIDQLFAAVADGLPQQRVSAIDEIHSRPTSGDAARAESVCMYGFDITSKNADGAVGRTPNPLKLKVMTRAVPQLIEALKGQQAVKAHDILVQVQPACPPVDYAVWSKWWREKGEAWYARYLEAAGPLR